MSPLLASLALSPLLASAAGELGVVSAAGELGVVSAAGELGGVSRICAALFFDAIHRKIDRRFYDVFDVQLRADPDFLAADLGIVFFALIAHVVKLDLVVHAVANVVIIQTVQRVKASMETFRAEVCFQLFIGLALLVLKRRAAIRRASHVFVESLVSFH
ncbi:MAG: hypothetical protein KHW91_05355 [Clostridiales bacterium]|nr:hypothetical protein [Clostridiales bacterium]